MAYDTQLSGDEEQKFQQWSTQNGNPSSADYDMRGFWKANGEKGDNGHYPDTYKKPNHPTFSEESQYSGTDGHQGGHWTELADGKWNFTLGPTNITNGADVTEKYLADNDPDSTLDEAGSAAAGRAAQERQALKRREDTKRALDEQQGIGMDEPNLKLEGPNADAAAAELAKMRGKAHWPKNQPLPEIYRTMAEARAEGYTRDEVNQHVADMRKEAEAAGYSNDEINQHLMGVAPRENRGMPPAPNPTADKAGNFLRGWQDAWFGPRNLAGSMNLPRPGDVTVGDVWKSLGWNMWDAAKTFPGGVIGGAAAIAELSDGREKTDGETVKLLFESTQFVGAFAPFLGRFAKLPKMGSPALDGEILPPAGGRGGPPAFKPNGPIIEGEIVPERTGLNAPKGVPEPTPAQQFPKFEDFLDAATKRAMEHPEGLHEGTLAQSLNEYGQHFMATGEHPMDTAVAGKPLLLQDLRAPEEPTSPQAKMEAQAAKMGQAAEFAAEVPIEELDNEAHWNGMLDLMKRLMKDETGAIRWPWRNDIRPDEMFRPDPMKMGEMVNDIRAMFDPAGMSPGASGAAKSLMAWSALDVERAAYRLSQYGRYVGELSTDMRYNMIAAYQRGLVDMIKNDRARFNRLHPNGPMRAVADNYLQPGSPLFGFLDEVRGLTDRAWSEMDNLGIAPGYVNWYYPGQWKEMEPAKQFVRGRLGGRNRGFRSEKTIPDILEGIAQGLTPTSDNPIQVITARLASQYQYIRAFKTLDAFEKAGAVLPQHMVTDAMMADGWAPISQFFSLPKETNAKWGHPDAVRLLGAMTDSGFAKYSVYRVVRSMANFVTSVNLIGPGFHSTFVTLDAMSTDLALGMQEMSRVLMNPQKGLWSEAGNAAVSFLRSPLAPILNVRAGAAMRKVAKTPGLLNQPTVLGLPTNLVSGALSAYMEGGGRLGLEDIYRSSRSGSFWPSLKSQVMPSEGHATFLQELGQMRRDVAGDVRVGGVLKVPAWVGLYTIRMVARMGDTLSAPLMEQYVPLLKAGTFYRHMQSAMRAAPNMGPLEIQRVAGNVSSMLDNRFGEMVYDNKFWNAYAKTAGQLAFRAMGFNYGALDTLAVGTKDIGKALIGRPDGLREPLPTINPKTGEPDIGEVRQFSSKASALIGMVMFTALMGAMIGVYNGTFDKEQHPYDYLYPKLADGTRIKMPSHMNNAYEFYNHPGQSFRNRINGLWVMGYDAARNLQWDDRTPISPPKHEDFTTRMEDYAMWMQRQMWPYSMQQMYDPTKAQKDIDPSLRMLGVGPAPWEIRNPEGAKKFKARQDKTLNRAYDKDQKKKAHP